MILLGFIMSLVYMQAVHGWLSAYERLVNSQNFFSPYLTQEDMSRLGRNYLQVGMYTEMIFPQKGVRFIAINDGVDSAQGDNDFAPLRNIFNEWLVRDTSKKIKAVKRSKGMSGKPITSKPVYGYLMDEDENFIIDEEAAPVVKQIYNLCLAGNGPTKIARMLTEQQIPTPGTLEYRRTGSTRRYHPGYECKWATNTVVHILENREYTGCLVNFKTEKLSYKVKHSVENPPEKQVIFENHHEPIIDTQTWERVQELRKQRKRPNRYDEVGLFSGILFCADCGSVMYQQRYQTDKRKQDCYICGNYKKRTHDCTAHFIRTDLLTAGVLSNLRKVTSYGKAASTRRSLAAMWPSRSRVHLPSTATLSKAGTSGRKSTKASLCRRNTGYCPFLRQKSCGI